MGSTVRTPNWSEEAPQLSAGSLRWRSWPLLDRPHWSWAVPLLITAVSFGVYRRADSILLGAAAGVCLAAALSTFFLPTTFEVTTFGLRRRILNSVRLYPWPSIRAYQLRTTGAVLFQRTNPTPLDAFNSLFVPFPPDVDELMVALKLYLPHAAEVPSNVGLPESAPKKPSA